MQNKQLARVLAASYAIGPVRGYWSDENSLTSARTLTVICQGQRRQLLLRTLALRLVSRLFLRLASISFSLLSFNASEPDGRSRFRRFLVYGRTQTSEQEFITWHRVLGQAPARPGHPDTRPFGGQSACSFRDQRLARPAIRLWWRMWWRGRVILTEDRPCCEKQLRPLLRGGRSTTASVCGMSGTDSLTFVIEMQAETCIHIKCKTILTQTRGAVARENTSIAEMSAPRGLVARPAAGSMIRLNMH